MTEITRKLAAELPSLAIKTGKSSASINITNIDVALSNMEVGTPVLLLDLTKRPVMPTRLPENTVTHPAGEDAGPAARRRQIKWYREQVEKEEARRVKNNLPSYDLDVCMISHFHDGAACMCSTQHTPQARMPRRTHRTRRTRRTRCTRCNRSAP